MCGLIQYTFYVLIFSLCQCSSIITKSMIRMPEEVSSLFPRSPVAGATLPEPSKLVASPDDRKYQIIYPMERDEAVGRRSLQLDNLNSQDPKQNTFKFQKHTDGNLKSPKAENHKTDQPEEEKNLQDEKNFTIHNTGSVDSKYLTSNLTSRDISCQYWSQYRNFYTSVLNNTNNTNDSPNLDMQLRQFNIFEIIQDFPGCIWEIGVVRCLKYRLGDIIPSFIYDFLKPKPSDEEDDDVSTDRKGKFDESLTSNDEGRKRLSKKLQIILPILMLLKMTMLPALAVMALVTGKAFLMSLLSLGVALVSASIQSPLLRADKRQEISPQSPIHNDHTPNSYYYMM